ncbi:hypothetical protein ACIP4U_26525 [Streptomyces caelestis]|uniref:hypothetical protein n=1 Tax=Streptomyces caelestis TaxID=36816 RepID=UPI00380E16E0
MRKCGLVDAHVGYRATERVEDDRCRPPATADMVATRLARPDGSQRKLAVIATGELIESNGRLLAYTAPWFSGGSSDPLPPRDDPRRRTFNLDMVALGWAATFLIYPSIPPTADLNLLLDEAEAAWTQQLGVWAQFGQDLLLGYEYRGCIKLGAREVNDPAKAIGQAYQRVCVDLRTLTEVSPARRNRRARRVRSAGSRGALRPARSTRCASVSVRSCGGDAPLSPRLVAGWPEARPARPAGAAVAVGRAAGRSSVRGTRCGERHPDVRLVAG